MLSRYTILVTNAGSTNSLFWLYFTESKHHTLSVYKLSSQLTVLMHRLVVSIGLRRLSYALGHSQKGVTTAMLHNTSQCHWIKIAPTSLGISFLKNYLSLELAFSHLVGYRMHAGLISSNPMFICMTLVFQQVLIVNSFYSEYSWRSILRGVC